MAIELINFLYLKRQYGLRKIILIYNINKDFLLNKVKNKDLFISFALEYFKMYNAIKSQQVNHVYTQLPIQLDATCNRYQYLSMLSKDNDLGRDLNLISYKKKKY